MMNTALSEEAKIVDTQDVKSLSEYLEQKLRLRLVIFQTYEEEGFGKG